MTTIKEALQKFRDRFHQYTMDDPRDVMVEELSGNIEDFIEQTIKEERKRVKEIVEREKCEVPPRPLPTNPADYDSLNFGFVDSCLKYAGRYNYNKALNDILNALSQDK